jgi:hypothetical protein
VFTCFGHEFLNAFGNASPRPDLTFALFHMQYIAVLRKCKMKERLRKARKAMHNRFPFSEALWLEWLGDECAGGKEDNSQIMQLYEQAVQDYLSVKLWTEYVQ